MASRLISYAARSRFIALGLTAAAEARIAPAVFRGLSTKAEKSSALTINNDADLYKEGDSIPDKEEGKNEVEIYLEKMHEQDANLVYTSSMLPAADPHLPENPAEVAATDPAHDTWSAGHYFEGAESRTVHVKQKSKRQSQAPTNAEQTWIISFMDEGETGRNWENPLMGWKSGADPMHNMLLQMEFDTAKEAVYFAKKRGWNFVVDEPKYRPMRFDGATYQDNFLPQNIAYEVMSSGTKVSACCVEVLL
jgi:hypothetical protein